MSIELLEIEAPQEMSFSVLGPKPANTLLIYTGTAVFNFRGKDGNWSKDTLSFDVGQKLSSTQYRKAIGCAALASIANGGKSNNAGWAVDKVEVKRSAVTSRMNVTLSLAVSDSDGYVHRVSYTVHVLAAL